MDASITLNELGLIIIFAIILAVGVYAVIALRNISESVKEITGFIRQHRKELDKSVLNIAITSENMSQFSRQIKKGIGEAEDTLETISRKASKNAPVLNEKTDQFVTYALIFGEVAKALADLFSTRRKS
jgi:methyl-accepting chemotaxis protein